MRKKIIAVDFDGTLCMNEGNCYWPYLGQANEKLVTKLKEQQKKDVALILWTCREGELLRQAVNWCRIECGLTFDAVNDNIQETKTYFGNDSRKIYCDYYIDDKGCTPDAFYHYLED